MVEKAPEENVDIAFKAIGGGVSLLSPGAKASSDYHPARVLSVSNRFGLTFFATPAGFGVVTADVLELSSGPKPASASEKCLASVELEKVSIVELSKDELTLAVCAGFAVRFYRVPSLALKTDTRRFEIRDIGDDALIKDFQWCSLDQDKNKGKLLVGKIGEEPTFMKENVSAACWSQFGKQIMYATSMKLTIASSDFAKSFIINPRVEFPGCEEGLETHVDALRWISPQSIVISYVQSEDDEEITCPLLVLSASGRQQLDEASTECSALAVTRRFPAIEASIIPPMNSPYMLV
ncbi:uncharacterized protein LOC112349139 [Selaginella moellendorffii]|uniref:uncharacterized protein LOC112349139 n=1 Tax=Selaginella moellendorffii TaxID=88036 RepID=UPI000D1CB7D2|nr:uncharacterized protein LOC112349139 [Selaginella moellendorffii]|eukprot:XP_024538710.1 uncharacterized protein LOC112349139 [Selaginella moellendorffii]